MSPMVWRRWVGEVRVNNMKMREVAELDFGLLGYITNRETGWRRPLWSSR